MDSQAELYIQPGCFNMNWKFDRAAFSNLNSELHFRQGTHDTMLSILIINPTTLHYINVLGGTRRMYGHRHHIILPHPWEVIPIRLRSLVSESSNTIIPGDPASSWPFQRFSSGAVSQPRQYAHQIPQCNISTNGCTAALPKESIRINQGTYFFGLITHETIQLKTQKIMVINPYMTTYNHFTL